MYEHMKRRDLTLERISVPIIFLYLHHLVEHRDRFTNK